MSVRRLLAPVLALVGARACQCDAVPTSSRSSPSALPASMVMVPVLTSPTSPAQPHGERLRSGRPGEPGAK